MAMAGYGYATIKKKKGEEVRGGMTGLPLVYSCPSALEMLRSSSVIIPRLFARPVDVRATTGDSMVIVRWRKDGTERYVLGQKWKLEKDGGESEVRGERGGYDAGEGRNGSYSRTGTMPRRYTYLV